MPGTQSDWGWGINRTNVPSLHEVCRLVEEWAWNTHMYQNISKYEKHKDFFKNRVIWERTRVAEVAAALDWGLRETSREAAVPPPDLRVNRNQIWEVMTKSSLAKGTAGVYIMRQEGAGRSQDLSASSLHPQQPQSFHPKSKQLVSTSQPVVSAQWTLFFLFLM